MKYQLKLTFSILISLFITGITIFLNSLGCTNYHPYCDTNEVNIALEEISNERPEISEIADRMIAYCYDDVSDISKCMRDAYGCTLWIGTSFSSGRMVIKNGTPIYPLIKHEAEHWYLWNEENACSSHESSCGWNWERVE